MSPRDDEIVVDLDLEKFFDRVNHDILMGRLARRIGDKRLLRIIRRFLEAGMMQGGRVRRGATRGRRKAGRSRRCWPTCCWTTWTRNWKSAATASAATPTTATFMCAAATAGERVMASVTRFLEGKLKLKVNRDKSAVAHVEERKFLGHRLLGGGGLGIAPKAIERFKEKVRKITRRNRGVKLEKVIEELNPLHAGLGELLPPRLGQRASATARRMDSAKSCDVTG